jgi:hypothetical protein
MEELAKWELNGREIKNAIKTVIGNGWRGTTMNQQRELYVTGMPTKMVRTVHGFVGRYY